jgi:hypothetical protein
LSLYVLPGWPDVIAQTAFSRRRCIAGLSNGLSLESYRNHPPSEYDGHHKIAAYPIFVQAVRKRALTRTLLRSEESRAHRKKLKAEGKERN